MLLIDGHNLIGTMPDIDLGEPDDEWLLVERLRAYAARRSDPVMVVFDSGSGPPPTWNLSGGGVSVRFAPPGTEADAVILRILHRSKTPHRIAVVTSDHQLADRVRSAGGEVRSSRQFALVLSSPRPPAEAISSSSQSPDPRDPAFADIYQGFVAVDKDEARFGADINADLELWIYRLYGEDPREAERAAHWLGRFGGAKALGPLRDALTHSNSHVRAAALLAFADLGDRRAVDDVIERLIADSSTMVREAAAQSLGRLGGQKADLALEAALRDPKGKVRKAARASLSQVRARRS
jgi:predicted RNA-binding protein with PIN domain